MTTSEDIVAACEAEWQAHRNDCSGFVKAVAARLGVVLTGQADDIVDEIRQGRWTVLTDGPAAAAGAAAGRLVVAGLKGSAQAVPNIHGHVAIIVAGPLAHGLYPTGYWGSLGGAPAKAQTVNYAWTQADRDKLIYAAIEV